MIGRGPVAEVLSLPEAERLPHALDLLREFAGDDAGEIAGIMRRFGVSNAPARVYSVLNRAGGCVVSVGALMAALGSEAAGKRLIGVYVCRLRGAGAPIITHFRLGYSLASCDVIPPEPPRPPWRARMGEPWTRAEDAEILRMVAAGSCLSAIAEEAERSERAVSSRLRQLREAGA